MSGKTDRSFDAHSFISQDYMKVESLIYKSNDIEMYDSKSLEIIEEHNTRRSQAKNKNKNVLTDLKQPAKLRNPK